MAAKFSIEIPNLTQLESKFAAAPATINRIMGDAVRSATTLTQTIEKSQTPVRYGTLRKSISFEVKGLTGTVYPNMRVAPYAGFVEGGTGLYGPKHRLIYPQTAKVLATKINPGFGSKSKGGYFIIGKYSRGQRPNRYVDRTYVAAVPRVKAVMRAALDTMVKAI